MNHQVQCIDLWGGVVLGGGSNGTDLGLEQSAAQAPKNAQLPPPPTTHPQIFTFPETIDRFHTLG